MAVVKGFATLETIELCWGPNKVDIPKAPGLGLLLDKVYPCYSKPIGNSTDQSVPIFFGLGK